MSSKKRRKVSQPNLSSSSEDDGLDQPSVSSTPPEVETVLCPRSSERIKSKRNREFHMPSREEVLGKISSGKSPNKSYSHLQPRRLVNNFTRVTHRYNYDPNYTSGESSLEDFIVFSESEDEEPEEGEQIVKEEKNSSDDSGTYTFRSRSTRKRRPTLPVVESDDESDSSDENIRTSKRLHKPFINTDSSGSGMETGLPQKMKRKNLSLIESDSCDSSDVPLAKLRTTNTGKGTVPSKEEIPGDHNDDMSDSEEESVAVARPQKRNVSVIASDSSDSGDVNRNCDNGKLAQIAKGTAAGTIKHCQNYQNRKTDSDKNVILELLKSWNNDSPASCPQELASSTVAMATTASHQQVDHNCNISNAFSVKQEPHCSRGNVSAVSQPGSFVQSPDVGVTTKAVWRMDETTIKAEPVWRMDETTIKKESSDSSTGQAGSSCNADGLAAKRELNSVAVKVEAEVWPNWISCTAGVKTEPGTVSGVVTGEAPADKGAALVNLVNVEPEPGLGTAGEGGSNMVGSSQIPSQCGPDMAVLDETQLTVSSTGSGSTSGSEFESSSRESSSDEDEDLTSARMRHLASRSKKMKNRKDRWLQKFEELKRRRAKMTKKTPIKLT